MPTVLAGLGDSGPGRPVPVVSALVEFGSALHVLRDPGHHWAEAWAAEVRAAMGPRLAAWSESWWWTTQAIRSAPFVTPAAAAGSGQAGEQFADQVARLRAVPPRRLAAQLLRPIAPGGDAQAALYWSASRGPELRAVVEALVSRPAEAVTDFLDFLGHSWQAWFGTEWARVQPLLAARARRFGDAVTAFGPVPALTSLDPAVTAAATGRGVTLAKVRNTRHDVSRRGLLVAASTWIRPHLYVADVPGHPVLLIYPADAGPAMPPAAEVLHRLGAVASHGRLEVARAIATEPRTAGEIAALWHTDPTLVNRHLRALAAAGLARPVRQGRFVRYQLDAGAVESLGADLLALLLR